MDYCGTCGQQIKEGAQFCGSCGAPVNQNASVKSRLVTIQGAGIGDKIRTMNRTQKVIVGITFLLLILLIIGYQIGLNLTSKEKVIEDLKAAIAEKDAKKLASLLVSDDPRLIIDENSVKGFLSYMENNPSYLNELIESLTYQAEQIDKNNSKEEATADYYEFGQQVLKLKRVGKSALIFDKYRFEVLPVYVTLQTNYEGAKLFINGQEVATANSSDFSKEFGPYLPGIYEAKAVYQGQYTTLETKTQLNLFDDKNVADLYLDGHYIDISSNFPDAKVFVNGKDTGLTVEQIDELGPVAYDGSTKIHLEKEFPWGKFKSEEIAITKDSFYEIEVSGLNDQVKQDIMAAVNLSDKSISEAYVSADPSKITGFSQNLIAEKQDRVQNMIDSDEMFLGKGLVKTVFDLDSFDVYLEDDGYYASVVCNTIWQGGIINKNASEEKKNAVQNEEPSDNYWRYTLKFDPQNKKWLVTETESIFFGYTFKNKQEFQF